MSQTTVQISNLNGLLTASQKSVKIASGDSIVFSAPPDSSATLFFSPACSSILSPAPSGPMTITAGESRSFTFTSDAPGAYSVFFESDPSTAPGVFPLGNSSELVLGTDPNQIGFEVIGTGGTKTGFVGG